MKKRITLTLCLVALATLCPARGAATYHAAAFTAPSAALAACDVEAYVLDTDPKGLNVRDAPGVGGRVVAVIPLDEDGTIVHLVASSPNGWVQLDHAETIGGTVVLNRKGWVSGNMLATESRGYGSKSVKLFARPRARKVAGTMPPETEARVAGCEANWISVKYKSLTGWLQPEDQCPNPVTTCN